MTWGAQHDWPRAIVHVDGDAFFAACEQAVHPEYKGKPVVTGLERGIVSAASYEAKARGISRGVALHDVLKICPDAIIVPSDYETYSLFSKRMFAIMRRTTPCVEEYSIDEGFADITGLRGPSPRRSGSGHAGGPSPRRSGSGHAGGPSPRRSGSRLGAANGEARVGHAGGPSPRRSGSGHAGGPMHASYETIAQTMQEAICSELGITVSVGLSVSKVLAKIGSKYKKPRGFTSIPADKTESYLVETPLEKIWGIGPQTTAYAAKFGITTAFDFISHDEEFIIKNFAKPQLELWKELRGESIYPVVPEEKSKYASISKTRTFTPPSTDRSFVFAQLSKNLENACIKARRHHLVTQRIVVFLKTQEFEHATAEGTLSRLSAYPHEMMAAFRQLFDACFRNQTPYRATGVVLTHLMSDTTMQRSLFERPLKLERLQRMYAAVDILAEQFGKHVVTLGSSLLAHKGHLCTCKGALCSCSPRGVLPDRKLNRLKGETKRLHLNLPLLLGAVR